MNKENCAIKLVDDIILYYDARSKKHQSTIFVLFFYILVYIERAFVRVNGKLLFTVSAFRKHRISVRRI